MLLNVFSVFLFKFLCACGAHQEPGTRRNDKLFSSIFDDSGEIYKENDLISRPAGAKYNG